MDLKKLAATLIPDEDLPTLEECERAYPPRNLKEGAEVTRLAPSPTGFIHLGNLYSALADERIAHTTGGIFYLRIEDTDEKRKVEGAVESVIRSLNYFGLNFDEGAEIAGENAYGPYYQRQRAKIYRAYAKDLIERGLAYPCFCTEEELDKIRNIQTEKKEITGYYGEYAVWRNKSEEEVYAALAAGKPFVIRLRSQGDVNVKHTFRDAIKGSITVTENNQDVVILKSDGIPTYHFAHAIDDHFMRTTLVIRGEEWLSSLPIHIELFSVLGFKLPRYGHTCSLMKVDGGTKRKLSKRKDPELSLDFYRADGYYPVAVIKYLMTILNSNFEEWAAKNPDKDYKEFPFSVSKMGKSGALFDLDKLNDVSRDELSKLTPEAMYDFLNGWVSEFGTDADRAHFKDRDYIVKILALIMGAGQKKRRKDIWRAGQGVRLIDYFFDDTFAPEYSFRADGATVNAMLSCFAATYDPSDDNSAWFAKLKAAAAEAGFAAENSEYKQNPEAFKGSVSDAAEIVRIAITGSPNSPDLCTVMGILGRERSLARLAAAIN
ncbi:MAG TPA: glutamate--tRNA ligase [Candidatus Coproplasma excrementigallinarum]|uniref:Glutamate--tRNA ligase n=1 Tax=Candidatus Coproplasma excrementigallinarum TaxID=2840747 RepID=A0A9D1SIC0_9FIRM|nr:glutamate--tRNA ligase [Candidatus Coproplasma excrementigallinarum]